MPDAFPGLRTIESGTHHMAQCCNKTLSPDIVKSKYINTFSAFLFGKSCERAYITIEKILYILIENSNPHHTSDIFSGSRKKMNGRRFERVTLYQNGRCARFPGWTDSATVHMSADPRRYRGRGA